MSKQLISIYVAFLLAVAGFAISSFVDAGKAYANQPTVTYSTTTPWPGQQVTATLDDSTGVSSYQWQWSLNGISWGDAGETGNRTVTFTVPNKAGFKFRLSWMRNGVREYASTHVTVTDETVTYSTTTPWPGQQVTATLSGGTSGVTYQWQASWDGNSWGDAIETGNDTATFTVPSSTGMKFRVTWTRSGIGKNASSYVTVTDETVTYSTSTPAPGQQVTATLGGGTSGVTYQWQASWDGNSWGDAIETGNDTATFTVPANIGMKFRVTWTRNGVWSGASSSVTVTSSSLSYSSTTPSPGTAVTATLGDETGVTAYQWQASWDGNSWGDAIEPGNASKTLTVPANIGMKFRVTWTRNGVRENASSYITVTIPSDGTHYSNTTPAPNTSVTAVLGNTTGVTAYQWQYSTDTTTWANAGEPGNTTTTLTMPHYGGVYFRLSWTRNGTQEYATSYVTVTPVVTYSSYTPAPGTAVTATLADETGVTAYQWQASWDGNNWGDAIETGNDTKTITLPWNAGMKFRATWTRNGVEETPTNYVTLSDLKVVSNPWAGYSNSYPPEGFQVTANMVGNTSGITAYQWQWSVRGSNSWGTAGETGYNTTTLTVPNKPMFTFRITWIRNGVWETNDHKVTVVKYVAPHVLYLSRTAEEVGQPVTMLMDGTLDGITEYRWQWTNGCGLASSSDVWTDVASSVPGYNTKRITLPTTRTWARYRISWLNNGVWEYPRLNVSICAIPEWR